MLFIKQKLQSSDLQIKNAAQQLGLDVAYVDLQTIYSQKGLLHDTLKSNMCVCVHTSIDTLKYLQSQYNIKSLTPWEDLTAVTYMAYWGKLCFNYEGVFLPAAEVIRRYDELAQSFNSKQGLFVKPNCNTKAFGGQVYDLQELKSLIDYNCTPSTLCLVAPSYKIQREWRVFCCGGKVIASSLYKSNNKPYCKEDFSCASFAESVTPYPGLPAVYALDIGEWEGQYYIIEVSSVNCCGFYKADVKSIVNKMVLETELLYTNSSTTPGELQLC